MDVVRELSDRIIVLHNGQPGGRWQPAAVIASPVVQQATWAWPNWAEEPHERAILLELRACTRTSARTTSCTASTSRGARGRGDHAAGAQRRRQDHHAAHHHGPVAGAAVTLRFAARASTARATPDIAAAASPTCPSHGHLHRPDGEGEHGAGAARGAPRGRARPARLDWIFGLFPALKKFWLYPAGKLSGGQKQMLAVARAIIEPRADPDRRAEQGPGAVDHPEPDQRLPRAEAQQHHHPAGRAELRHGQGLGDGVAVMDNGRVVHAGRWPSWPPTRRCSSAAGPVAGERTRCGRPPRRRSATPPRRRAAIPRRQFDWKPLALLPA